MIDTLTCARRLAFGAWRIDRGRFLVAFALMLAFTLSAPLLALSLGRMTDAALGGRNTPAAIFGMGAALFAILGLAFNHFAHVFYFELSELAEMRFHEELLEVSNGSPGIEHHDRAEQADSLSLLSREGGQFRMSLEALFKAAGLLSAIAFGAAVLAWQNPWLLLLPVAALVPLATGRSAESALDRAKTAAAEQTRIGLGLFELATTARYAGELRVFGVGAELRRRHLRSWDATSRVLARAHVRAALLRGIGQVLFGLAYVGAVLLVLRSAISGHRSVGDIVLVITLATQVNGQVVAAVAHLQDLQRIAGAYLRLDGLRAVVASAGRPPTDAAVPDRLREGIVLEDVGFGYPDSGGPALGGVNLTLPAGATVAVVGENGAGKTTLVKLLSGFYPPSAGRILVDGTDLSRIPVERWRERMAVCFQDFVRFELCALEAVGVGDVPRAEDEPSVRAALERAHVADVLDHLDRGLDTQLGTSYDDDGTELSGGQWQKLALARALMRTEPLLLVLDEPTSALDPLAEHELFERYAEQARATARRTGAITLLISHRFSTVRMADLIVVLGDGRVLELGDHNALMAAGGRYAELYSLQASAYR